MKKSLFSVGITLITLLLLGGCTSQSRSADRGQLQEVSTSAKESLLGSTKVSLQEAVDIFQKAYPQTSITSIELSKHFRNPVYKIEGVDNTHEYELSLNAVNKKIVSQKKEQLDQDEQNDLARQNDELNLKDLVALSDIAKIAEKKLSGSKAIDFAMDHDLGITYWEVTVKHKMTKKEIKIDAQKGTVLEIEND